MKFVKTLSAIAAVALSGAVHAGVVPVGVQTNVSVAQVESWGWTACFQDNGGSWGKNDSNSFDTIRANCNGTHVMLADKAFGSDTFSILAAASTADVFTNTGDYNNTTHTANGSEWYFSESWSIGYTSLGNVVSRNSCDVELAGWNGNALNVGSCWHTYDGSLGGGWAFNNGSGAQSSQERWILTSNYTEAPDGPVVPDAPAKVPEPGSFALLGLGLLGLGFARKARNAA